MKKRKTKLLIGDILGILISFFVFIVPFIFIFVTSLKDRKEARLLRLSWPEQLHFENYLEVIQTNDYVLLRAFVNSIVLTAGTVLLLVLMGSMAGYVLQRNNEKAAVFWRNLLSIGLMVPVAILPTIWVLKTVHLYKTMAGMIFIEAALGIPYVVMLYRGYVASLPRELEEAGYIDGCSTFQLFAKIIFPLLKPVTATVIILNAVNVFNDFTNPLYFLPGTKNATVQLTLFNFSGRYSNAYNLLFADVLLITIPMLILFLFFNKRIVAGMVAGSVKG